MVNKTLLPPGPTPIPTSNSLKESSFPDWHGFRCVLQRTAAWESLGGLKDPRSQAWEGNGSRIVQGRTSDGECASHRTFAANGACAAAEHHCQQYRERKYRGLQDRQPAV